MRKTRRNRSSVISSHPRGIGPTRRRSLPLSKQSQPSCRSDVTDFGFDGTVCHTRQTTPFSSENSRIAYALPSKRLADGRACLPEVAVTPPGDQLAESRSSQLWTEIVCHSPERSGGIVAREQLICRSPDSPNDHPPPSQRRLSGTADPHAHFLVRAVAMH